MSIIDFNLDGLLQEAKDKSGLSDFGDQRFKTGLACLLETYSANDFTESSQKSLRRRMLDLLISRLQVEAAWQRNPEALNTPIKQPLFLTGLPRTGTSALFNLLANDSATRTLKLWEAHNPAPLADLKPGEEDPRYIKTKQYYDAMNAKSDFKKIHYMTADSAEECIFLTNHSFEDAAYGFEIFLEPYGEFFRSVEGAAQYQYHADLLRLLHSQRPASRWLLKAPSHLGHLDTITKLHSDSGIILTHRNPVEVVGSYCSMMMTVMPEQSKTDAKILGVRILDHLVDQVKKSMAARQQFNANRILDIHYNDIVSKPLDVVDQIYAHFSFPFSSQARESISQYIDDHPRGKHGAHNYDLSVFGLDKNKITERFAEYIDSYAIRMH
jgi:hypothetical protein